MLLANWCHRQPLTKGKKMTGKILKIFWEVLAKGPGAFESKRMFKSNRGLFIEIKAWNEITREVGLRLRRLRRIFSYSEIRFAIAEFAIECEVSFQDEKWEGFLFPTEEVRIDTRDFLLANAQFKELTPAHKIYQYNKAVVPVEMPGYLAILYVGDQSIRIATTIFDCFVEAFERDNPLHKRVGNRQWLLRHLFRLLSSPERELLSYCDLPNEVEIVKQAKYFQRYGWVFVVLGDELVSCHRIRRVPRKGSGFKRAAGW
ncbi:MAG: hypothetical protein ABIH21_04100 [Patescibacteria group bacterium]